MGQANGILGIVLKKLGPVTYSVEIENGRIFKQHIDQLKFRKEVSPIPNPSQDNSTIWAIILKILMRSSPYHHLMCKRNQHSLQNVVIHNDSVTLQIVILIPELLVRKEM